MIRQTYSLELTVQTLFSIYRHSGLSKSNKDKDLTSHGTRELCQMYRMMQLHNCADQPTRDASYKFHRILSQLCCSTLTSVCTPRLRNSHPHPPGTMQSAENKFKKNSLIPTLKRYSSAVSDMEKTVLLPSLLRDVPSDEAWDCEAAEENCRDLYANYMILKGIRNTVESSLLALDDHKVNNPAITKTSGSHLDAGPEALFQFHLRGLFSVMSELTKKTRSLTEKYLDIIGVAN